MDNNLTNIDDLFKQRLGNAEEAGRPGSWLKMKDLLDEHMPVGTVPTAPATGNKRKLGFAALLLLLSAITIGGGYEMYSSFKGNAVSDDTMALYASQGTGSGVAGGVMNNADERIAQPYNEFNNKENNTATSTEGSIVGGGTNNSATKTVVIDADQMTTTKGPSSSNTVTKRNNSIKSTVASNSDKSLNNNSLPVVKESATVASQNVTDNTKPATISSDNTQPKAIAGNMSKPQSTAVGGSTPAPQQTKQQSRDMGALALNSSAERMNNTGNKQLPSGVQADLNINTKPVPDNSNNNKTASTENYLVDTIDKIETRESVAKDGSVMVDTLSVGRVAIKSKKPAEEKEEATVAMNNNKDKDALPEELLLQAQNANLETEDGAGVYTDLSKKKVSSHKMKNYNGHRFEEMVRNAKFKMKSVKFYPGLVAGVNSSIAANNVSGFQLGFVGDLSLSDKWSVLTELKYVQRFNNNINFSESYYTNLDSSYNSGGGKVYTFDSVGNSYNFSTLGAFEMPIALRYNVKRFNVFGGVNLAYNLKTKVTQVDLPNQITKEGATGFSPDYTKMAGAPSVKVSDFTNRFTVGYLLGVSYNWSPSMRVDMRLTQSVWDNAGTNGQKTISKELYKVPNVQLNISYRFKQKAYKKFR